MTFYGVVTQGCGKQNVNEWMTSYQVRYANESGENFLDVMDSSGQSLKVSLLI